MHAEVVAQTLRMERHLLAFCKTGSSLDFINFNIQTITAMKGVIRISVSLTNPLNSNTKM